MESGRIKLETYIPKTHFKELQEALWNVDAGRIGNYECCMSYTHVTGTWRPLKGAVPYSGEVGEIRKEEEIKVEVVIDAERASETVVAVQRAHPYEKPVINLIPLLPIKDNSMKSMFNSATEDVKNGWRSSNDDMPTEEFTYMGSQQKRQKHLDELPQPIPEHDKQDGMSL